MPYPKPLNTLIAALKRLPGVGSRTAERYAFHVLNWTERQRRDLIHAVTAIETDLALCPQCGCLCDTSGCLFCRPERESAGSICVIATLRDAFAIEETGAFRGLYHVLGGVLSPLDGLDAAQLSIDALVARIGKLGLQEVVLALDATLEGDATALYLKERLQVLPVTVSRLAFGLPLGSAFAYVDGGTLARAFTGRNTF